MSNSMDMLKCNQCGTVYLPESTVTGRLVPHCSDIPLDREATIVGDYGPIEARILNYLEDRNVPRVVDPKFPFVKETENG